MKRVACMLLGAVIGLAPVTTACSDGGDDADATTTDAVSSSDVASSTSTVAVATTSSTTTSTSSTSTTTSTTTTTTLPPTTTTTIVTEGAVVLVANASSVPGAATRLTGALVDAGFHLMEPTNAAGNEAVLDASKVYVKAGGEAVGASIAALMGGIAIAPMPTPAWIDGATAALGDATVLVMLGKDLAGRPIPGLTAR